MKQGMNRRGFLRNVALSGAGLVVLRNARSVWGAPASQKLNVALVGVGGRGTWFVDEMPRMENIVAFCDVNDQKIAEAFKRWENRATAWPGSKNDWERNAAPIYQRLVEKRVKTFHDFRKMLDEMGKEIDAVMVATPDHTHAVASAAAIKAGKPVFAEKPLTRLVFESRALRELARKHKVVTAMGNQGTYSGAFRRALELIRDGTLGEIKEVHVWNSGGGSDRKEPPKGEEPVPEHLKWDLWLGPAKARPFHKEWLQRHSWREFGTCQLGNWASHSANLGFMALKVHELWLTETPKEPRPVIRIEAKTSGINRLSFPKWELIKWGIPARAEFPPITFTWYNGAAPGIRELLEPLMKAGLERQEALLKAAPENERPKIRAAAEREREGWRFAGTLVVGTKGTIHTTGHNMWFWLLPQEQFKGVPTDRPEQVEQSRGPEQDWFAAIRGGKAPWSNFDYADALNEFLMLGNVATQFESPLDFEPIAMKITNNAEADAALRCEYREGWTL